MPKHEALELVGRCVRKVKEEAKPNCPTCQGKGYQAFQREPWTYERDGKQYAFSRGIPYTLLPCMACRPRARI